MHALFFANPTTQPIDLQYGNVGKPQTLAPFRVAYLQNTARERKSVFAALMEAVKTHSLGQISHALYDVGGEYRRNM